jgi:hypothetical protein
MDSELTHSLMFFSVSCSPRNSCPKCPPQLAQSISVLIPSGSGTRFSALGKLPSKLGQPQPELNLFCDVKRGALHFLQTYVPSSKKSSYSPLKGASVALWTITFSCSGSVVIIHYDLITDGFSLLSLA